MTAERSTTDTVSFAALQRQLDPKLISPDSGSEPWDVLVVHSLNVSPEQMALVEGGHHYEERQLFALTWFAPPGGLGAGVQC
ncbi:MAG: hypothetical protein AB8E87_13180 [Prochlorococcus sp.]